CPSSLACAWVQGWLSSNAIVIWLSGLVRGSGGAVVFFWFLNMAVEGFPSRLSRGLVPYAFLLPGLSLIGLMLVYPTVQTVVYSFADDRSTDWVGSDNYRATSASRGFWQALLTNPLWAAVVP